VQIIHGKQTEQEKRDKNVHTNQQGKKDEMEKTTKYCKNDDNLKSKQNKRQ